ncbi:hypothetical protein JCM14467A_06970 [Vulcanisaeta sp. JCM 14467]
MIVLKSDKLRDVILDLGNRLNEVMQIINEIHAYSPDNEFANKLIRELRSKSQAAYVKGNTNITTKFEDVEITYVLTANGYKNAIKDAINYYTDMLMSIKQAVEFAEKLGISDEYTVMIDDSSIDVIIGYSLPDMSNASLLHLPSIKEVTEIPSVLSGVIGLTADELARVMKTVDEAISTIGGSSRTFETIVRLSDINYPEPFRKIEEVIGGSS